MDSLKLMRDSLIKERIAFLAELIDFKKNDPSLPALWTFAEMLIDEVQPPLKPPGDKGLDRRFAKTWFAVHEAWFVHNLTEEAKCLRSKK